MWVVWICSLLILLLHCVESQNERFDSPRANLSSLWVNNALMRNIEYTRFSHRGEIFRPILLYSPSGFGVRYACGFYKNSTSSGYIFSVLMVNVNSGARITKPTVSPQPVWAANRNRPVGENATLELTGLGNLVLRDENNVEIWSTDTGGKKVTHLDMLGSGNLVLSDDQDKYLWQSFDHSTDVLVLGQVLKSGMRLTSSISIGDFSEGSYILEMKDKTLRLFASGSPSQTYWSFDANKNASGDIAPYILYANGSILFFVTSASVQAYAQSGSVEDSDGSIRLLATLDFQYLKVAPDGNFGVYQENDTGRIFESIIGVSGCADWPGSCGKYSICNAGQCSCISSDVPGDIFTLNVPQNPSWGCRPIVSLNSCNNNNSLQQYKTEQHHFFEVKAAHYIPLEYTRGIVSGSLLACKSSCLTNCSCKMAIHWNDQCYTFDEVYTLRNASNIYPDNDFTNAPITLIKMQNGINKNATDPRVIDPTPSSNNKTAVIVILCVVLPVMGITILCALAYKRSKRRRREIKELALDAVAGLPRRFSYRLLQEATWNFSDKLGQGGFGTVFRGEIPDDKANIPVAVKRLESANQGHREFKTEVSIIASVQHFNLVQLRGFCAEDQHRLLVYELIPNGSLDKWLFNRPEDDYLSWVTRLEIALGTAQGLAYLHEQCREKIIHLDIKPQNILLDPDFKAKVCDFGLSRLMKRDESAVFTTMRGTPGYLAPEWLQSSITEKADVYSFGVVLLELLSGEKCLDNSRIANNKLHFPSWASERMSRGGSVMELLDWRLLHDMEGRSASVGQLVDIAFLCCQDDPQNRPSMGSVVQMLQDLLPPQ